MTSLLTVAGPLAAIPPPLLGEADFHAFTYTHGRVYGHDATSGRFLVSADGRRWEERSTLAAMLTSVAVSPADPDRVVAGTGDGHLVSGDGTAAPGFPAAGSRWPR